MSRLVLAAIMLCLFGVFLGVIGLASQNPATILFGGSAGFAGLALVVLALYGPYPAK